MRIKYFWLTLVPWLALGEASFSTFVLEIIEVIENNGEF